MSRYVIIIIFIGTKTEWEAYIYKKGRKGGMDIIYISKKILVTLLHWWCNMEGMGPWKTTFTGGSKWAKHSNTPNVKIFKNKKKNLSLVETNPKIPKKYRLVAWNHHKNTRSTNKKKKTTYIKTKKSIKNRLRQTHKIKLTNLEHNYPNQRQLERKNHQLREKKMWSEEEVKKEEQERIVKKKKREGEEREKRKRKKKKKKRRTSWERVVKKKEE